MSTGGWRHTTLAEALRDPEMSRYCQPDNVAKLIQTTFVDLQRRTGFTEDLSDLAVCSLVVSSLPQDLCLLAVDPLARRLVAVNFVVADGADPAHGFGPLAVAPDLRARGLGSEMCRRALQLSAARGGASLRLCVDGHNLDAMALYARSGFVARETLAYLTCPADSLRVPGLGDADRLGSALADPLGLRTCPLAAALAQGLVTPASCSAFVSSLCGFSCSGISGLEHDDTAMVCYREELPGGGSGEGGGGPAAHPPARRILGLSSLFLECCACEDEAVFVHLARSGAASVAAASADPGRELLCLVPMTRHPGLLRRALGWGMRIKKTMVLMVLGEWAPWTKVYCPAVCGV